AQLLEDLLGVGVGLPSHVKAAFVPVYLAAGAQRSTYLGSAVQAQSDVDRAFHQLGAVAVIAAEPSDVGPVGLDRRHLLAISVVAVGRQRLRDHGAAHQ